MIGNAVANNISNEANNALGANVNPDGNSQDGLDQYDRYKSSLKLFTPRQDRAHSPNISVENIHRMEVADKG